MHHLQKIIKRKEHDILLSIMSILFFIIFFNINNIAYSNDLHPIPLKEDPKIELPIIEPQQKLEPLPTPIDPPIQVETKEPIIPEIPPKIEEQVEVKEPEITKPIDNLINLPTQIDDPKIEETKEPIKPEETKTTVEDLLSNLPDSKDTDSKNEEMVLPKKDTLDFLEGSWRCDSGLIRVDNKEPIILEFSFDKNGTGTSWIKEKDGTIYKTNVKASIKNRVLTVTAQGPYTNPKSKAGFSATTITCTQDGDHTICSGKNKNSQWNSVKFQKTK